MASGPDRNASSRLGPTTPAPTPPAALLAEIQAALARGPEGFKGMPPAAVTALIQPLQQAIAAPGSVSPKALELAFEQLEDALEAVLLVPTPAPPV